MLSNLEVRVRVLETRTAALEADKVARALRGVGKSAHSAGKQAHESAKGFDLMEHGMGRLRRTIGTVAGLSGLGSIAFGLRDVFRAGQDWQAQQAQLQNALKNTGQMGAGVMDKLNRVIEATGTHGGFAPAEEAQGLANFIRLTGSSTKAIQLNFEALDFARGAHLDYYHAATLVARAQSGVVKGLATYIGKIPPVTAAVDSMTAAEKRLFPERYKNAKALDAQATAAKINAALIARFHGGMAAYSHTTAGAISNAENSFKLLSEQLGKTFLPIIANVARWLAKAADTITSHWPQIKSTIRSAFQPLVTVFGWAKTLIRFLGGIKETLLLVGAAVAPLLVLTAAIRGLAIAQAVWNAVADTNPYVLGLMAVAVAVTYVATHFKQFRAIVNSVFSWMKTAVSDVGRWFSQTFRSIGNAIASPFIAIGRLVSGAFNGAKRVVSSVVHWIVEKVKWLVGKITGVFHTVTSLPGKLLHGVGSFISNPFGLFHQGGLVRGFAPGGLVGGSGNLDSVPAMLTPGEFVLRKEVVERIGANNLGSINSLGSASGAGASYLPVTVQSILNSRVVAESTTHVALVRQAFA